MAGGSAAEVACEEGDCSVDLGGGGWDDEGRAQRVMLIPVNEGSSQAPLTKPYW